MDFTLNIPKDQMCPTAFMSSYGSATYRLVALIKRNKHDQWNILTNKLLLNFKGYYNVSGMALGPSIDIKQFLNGKITSIFTLNKSKLFVGRGSNFNVTLELEGAFDYRVDVIVKFLRNTKCGKNVQTEIILLQKQQSNLHEDKTIFKWNFDVPLISRVTYTNELFPFYSVRYFVKVIFH